MTTTTQRNLNFSAGPATLPEPVLQQAQSDLWNIAGSGIGICEHSHRGPVFEKVIAEAIADCRSVGDEPRGWPRSGVDSDLPRLATRDTEPRVRRGLPADGLVVCGWRRTSGRAGVTCHTCTVRCAGVIPDEYDPVKRLVDSVHHSKFARP